VHPEVRLIWTLCGRDVPANAAHLAEGEEVTWPACRCAAAPARSPDHGTISREEAPSRKTPRHDNRGGVPPLRSRAASANFSSSKERNGACRVRRGSKVGIELADVPIVLVIEDDPALQAMIEDALTEAGFEPAIAASGEEAVTLFIGRQTPYRALVTDISLLGRLNGWEVARAARDVDPDLPVIYMTGAAADQWPSHGVPNSILLTKPFAAAQLVTAVSQLMNAAPPSST
jgi:CheY-like chemotaxis protein